MVFFRARGVYRSQRRGCFPPVRGGVPPRERKLGVDFSDSERRAGFEVDREGVFRLAAGGLDFGKKPGFKFSKISVMMEGGFLRGKIFLEIADVFLFASGGGLIGKLGLQVGEEGRRVWNERGERPAWGKGFSSNGRPSFELRGVRFRVSFF